MKLGALAIAAVVAATGSALAQIPLAPPSARIDRLIRQMTVEEKLGQLTQLAAGRQKQPNSRVDGALRARIRTGTVGSLLNAAGADATRELQRIAVKESRLHIPLLFGLDVIHGYRTIFPVPLAMAASWDPALVERASRVAAVETAAAGVHWTFTPMIDVARDPRWGRIVEGAGEDPFLGSAMAVAQIRGLQGADLAATDSIMATAKHFAAYGAAEGGRDYGGADISERTLHEVYLPPFYAAAQAGAGSFMTSFNTIGGVPVTANRPLVRGLLRDGWGYQGLVVSDWLAIAELGKHGVAATDAEAGALALDAGIDMDMASQVYFNALKERVAGDAALSAELDEAVRRVLAAKERLGLFDNPYRSSDRKREAKAMLSPAHRQAAREAAVRSIVLLQNDDGLLPIAASARKIAVIGALAQDDDSQLGSWRALGDAKNVRGLLPALRAALPNAELSYVPGASPRSDDRSGIPAAVEAAKMADLVILVVGEDYDMTGEARSRSSLDLPGAQQALVDAVFDTGKPVVAVLTNGRPLALQSLTDRAGAMLETWFLGVEAGPAIADILTGRANPGGKLPVNFPRATGAVPFPYNHLPGGRPADPDPTKDTVRYHDLPITPLFPFGHGLSYTRFDYGPLAIDRESVAPGGTVTLSVVVRNAGPVAGDEVVQLYAHDPVASVSRPVQELRGFRRISLASGQAKKVSFTLSPAQFAIWNEGRWRIEPGEIALMIGSSSADIRLRGSIRIASAGEGHAPAAAIPTSSTEEIVP